MDSSSAFAFLFFVYQFTYRRSASQVTKVEVFLLVRFCIIFSASSSAKTYDAHHLLERVAIYFFNIYLSLSVSLNTTQNTDLTIEQSQPFDVKEL